MTDETQPPLRKLFSDPDYENDEADAAGGSNQRAPLTVLREAESLDPPLGQLLFEVLKAGTATATELARRSGSAPDETRAGLEELELQGYVARRQADGETVYELDEMWDAEEFPSGPVIPLVYQYNLLSDEQRLTDIADAIDAVVSEGDTVVDLGAGAGILSFLAAKRADQVYAVEVDPTVYERGRELIAAQDVDNVQYIKADARTVSLPESADVVLCEMLDTALAAELQVPVMNHATTELLAAEGRTIPYRAKSTVRLVESDYSFQGGEFPLPHFEAYGSRSSIVRSDESVYHEVCFEETNDLQVTETVAIEATSTGVVNGVQLNTYTQFAEGRQYTGASEWLNPPLTLPTDEPHSLDVGDTVQVRLNYTLGGGLDAIEYQVSTR